MILEFPFFQFSTAPAITCNDSGYHTIITTLLDYKDIISMHTHISNYGDTIIYRITITRYDMATINITSTSLAVSRYYFNCIQANSNVREATIRTLFPEIFI